MGSRQTVMHATAFARNAKPPRFELDFIDERRAADCVAHRRSGERSKTRPRGRGTWDPLADPSQSGPAASEAVPPPSTQSQLQVVV